MRTSLLFIRHAQTDLAGTFCGRTDPQLNAVGLSQLPLLAGALALDPMDVIYASDLLRAQQTAKFLALPRGVAVVLRPALRELDFGDWETLTWDQIELRDKAYAARWIAEFPSLPAPNGELIPLFKHRALQEIAWLRQQAAEQNIAVVTHAGVLRVLLEELGHFAPHHAWERVREYTSVLRCEQQSPTAYLKIIP